MSDLPPVAPIMVGGHGSPGGYEFSDDEVDSVIKKWEDLLTDLRTDRMKATEIAEVLPPGDEPAKNKISVAEQQNRDAMNQTVPAPLSTQKLVSEQCSKNGLGDSYAQKAQPAYFEPATVQGCPAVYADKSGDRPSGTCFAWVGVTDQLAVSVGRGIRHRKEQKRPVWVPGNCRDRDGRSSQGSSVTTAQLVSARKEVAHHGE